MNKKTKMRKCGECSVIRECQAKEPEKTDSLRKETETEERRANEWARIKLSMEKEK